MKAGAIALGGVLAALAVVFLTLGGMVPMATYACPMLASILLIPLRSELSKVQCVGWYIIVSGTLNRPVILILGTATDSALFSALMDMKSLPELVESSKL